MSPRPEFLVGTTYKVKIKPPQGGELTFYITVNCTDDGLMFKPYEVFVNCRDAQYWEHLTAVTLMVSRSLQAGVPVETIARDLKEISSSVTGHMAPGVGWVQSVYARIGALLEHENSVGQSPQARALLQLVEKPQEKQE